ncbi:PepSY domain-containing protein [Candidatus Woesearchaeota archaeon]|nr:PepSY domain-containing protein [Candidatus Woesearchaeota archaeon]
MNKFSAIISILIIVALPLVIAQGVNDTINDSLGNNTMNELNNMSNNTQTLNDTSTLNNNSNDTFNDTLDESDEILEEDLMNDSELENDSDNESVQTMDEEVTSTNLGFRQLGEALNDFMFNLQSAFTFREESKLELLQDRVEELRVRQQEWVELKQQALIKFDSEESDAEEKQDVLDRLKEKHNDIIKDYVEVIYDLNTIKVEAREDGEIDIEQRANNFALGIEDSDLSLGLNTNSEADLAEEIDNESTSETSVSAQEAIEIAEDEFDFDATSVTEREMNGRLVYLVEGTRSDTFGTTELDGIYQVLIDANTGIISSVNINIDIASGETIENDSLGIDNQTASNQTTNQTTGNQSIGNQSRTMNESRTNRTDNRTEAGGEVEEDIEIRINGNINFSEEDEEMLRDLVEDFIESTNEAKIAIEVDKDGGAISIASSIAGDLTSEQEGRWDEIQEEIRSLVSEFSSVQLRIEAEREFSGESNQTSSSRASASARSESENETANARARSEARSESSSSSDY